MDLTARRSTALVGAIASATTFAAVAPAAATDLAPSRVTVHATDYTPASGQTFRLYGAVWSGGIRVPATVRVKTFRDGHWVQLQGAVMETNRDNRYNLRIILQMKGERLLRVVGDPRDPDIATSSTTITVTVH
ncbi:hypothetical protein ACT8ZV_02915 [Nocardioides sp. MAHUQ-72]|uniref:hypothetical protein n=1 Tax=unclassified Nocardioides TaxID=2615069 RepID=UPI00361DB1BB